MPGTLLHGNCLELLKTLPDRSTDLVLTDLPYGMTQNIWDQRINIQSLWEEWLRIIKPRGVVALFGSGLFSSDLIQSARNLYKYTIIWKKSRSSGFLNAKKQPLRIHEDILIFYQKQPTYHPQMKDGEPYKVAPGVQIGSNYGKYQRIGGTYTQRYPTTILEVPCINNVPSKKGGRTHPTQKPVALGEWIISTYTNPGDLVVDVACGTGAFLVAANNLNRNWWGCDIHLPYVEEAQRRLGN